MIELQKDEKVIYEIRRHWYILLAESALLIFLFFIPWLVLPGLEFVGVPLRGDAEALFVFLTASWTLLLWIAFGIVWTGYYLDVWLVTDGRIIDIEQRGLFSREVSEFRLDRIQDVTIEVKGFLPTLLRFGDIYVQTAGETREFMIRHIPHPYHVKEVIVRAANRAIAEPKNQGNL